MAETKTPPASLGSGPNPDFRHSDNTSSDHSHSQDGARSGHQHCPIFPQSCKLAPVASGSQSHSRFDAGDAETMGSPSHSDALGSSSSSEPKDEAKGTSPPHDACRRTTATSHAHRRQHSVTEARTTDAAPLLPEAGSPQNEIRLLTSSSHEVAAPSAVDPVAAAEKAREAAGESAPSKNGDPEKGATQKLPRRKRDLTAYWLLGFCNNFTYWVMITAAYDLLTLQPRQVVSTRTERHSGGNDLVLDGEPWGANSSTSSSSSSLSSSPHNSFSCLRYSTGAILVADTLPATTLTVVAPLLQVIPTDARVVLLGIFCVAAYLTLGLANPEYVFLGVALASASRGLSDATFLGHASQFHKHVLSLWSSGTGVATFVGPLLYSALTTAGLPPRTALLSFLAVPSIIALSFWCLLSRTKGSSSRGCWRRCTGSSSGPDAHTDEELNLTEGPGAPAPDKLAAALKKKILLYMRALGYVAPLTAFYLIMYFTNQGLLELVYFPASFLSHSQQYAWANTVRCFGTLISRSAHKLLLLPRMWMYVALAAAILVVVGCEAHFHFLPSLYVILTLLLAQGILEGSAFRSSMFNIYNKTTAEERSFCLAVFPVSLFLPAVVAGLAAIPTQSFLCSIHYYA